MISTGLRMGVVYDDFPSSFYHDGGDDAHGQLYGVLMRMSYDVYWISYDLNV